MIPIGTSGSLDNVYHFAGEGYQLHTFLERNYFMLGFPKCILDL